MYIIFGALASISSFGGGLVLVCSAHAPELLARNLRPSARTIVRMRGSTRAAALAPLSFAGYRVRVKASLSSWAGGHSSGIMSVAWSCVHTQKSGAITRAREKQPSFRETYSFRHQATTAWRWRGRYAAEL